MDDNEEENYQTPLQPEMYPVTNQEQLGQDILRTFARISDPDSIQFKKIKKAYPVLKKKIIKDGKGKEKETEYIEEELREYDIPIRVQSEYHELITDDIARAFLSSDDFFLYLDNGDYCQAVKSFAKRYGLNLSLHHNRMADMTNQLVVASGAVNGQRVTLAKANIVDTTYKATQTLQQGVQRKKKKGFLEGLLP
jgi:hypothetical protein